MRKRGQLPCGNRFPVLFLLIVFAPLAVRGDDLKPFTATYALKMGAMAVGTMVRRLAIGTERGYEFSAEVEPAGIATLFQDGKIVETSQGAVIRNRPRPDHYAYRQAGGKKNRSLVVAFDWKTGRLATTYKGRDTENALAPGLLDKLVYQLALMQDLAAGSASLEYRVADNDGVTVYALARRGRERIVTPRGTFDAERVERVNGSSKRRTVLWCAPEIGFLPVKIEHREKDGRVTTALLQRLD